jgi:hypothetical protein
LVGKNNAENYIIANTLSYVNLFSSFLGFFGLMKFGRRTLMLTGYVLIAISLLTAGVL